MKAPTPAVGDTCRFARARRDLSSLASIIVSSWHVPHREGADRRVRSWGLAMNRGQMKGQTIIRGLKGRAVVRRVIAMLVGHHARGKAHPCLVFTKPSHNKMQRWGTFPQ